ncbi:MAG: hypothetical protein HW420_128 [Candidatus Nitrosotenuis sp.]|nr:hypothetical protein [Candidatus Nitrosotenuis sp.]
MTGGKTELLKTANPKDTLMSEPGKIEKGHTKNMNLYQSPRKAETGCVQTDYCRNYGNSRLRRSKARSTKQEEAAGLSVVVHNT